MIQNNTDHLSVHIQKHTASVITGSHIRCDQCIFCIRDSKLSGNGGNISVNKGIGISIWTSDRNHRLRLLTVVLRSQSHCSNLIPVFLFYIFYRNPDDYQLCPGICSAQSSLCHHSIRKCNFEFLRFFQLIRCSQNIKRIFVFQKNNTFFIPISEEGIIQ